MNLRPNNPRWLHADERGSIVAVSTASGASIATYSYGPYGETASYSGSRFRYTGQMTLPEAGLYHFKARAYSAALGRFLQPDPIGLSGGLNLYAYANGDPINLTDPLGLASECDSCDMEFVIVGRSIQSPPFWTVLENVFRQAVGAPRNSIDTAGGGIPRFDLKQDDKNEETEDSSKSRLKEIICALPALGIGAGMDLYAGLGGSVGAGLNFDIPNGRFGLALNLGVGAGLGAGVGGDIGVQGTFGPNGGGPLSLNLGVSGGFAAPLFPAVNVGSSVSYNIIGTDEGFSGAAIGRAGTPMAYINMQANGGFTTPSLYDFGC